MSSITHRSRSGSRILWVAVPLLAVGIGLLGFVAWEFFGTTYLATQRRADIVREVERAWAANPETKESDAALDAGNLPRGVSALVRIPRFGDGYVVPVLGGTEDYALSRGLGHYEDTANAGTRGNYALAGHRITHGEPLREMPELRPGDEIIVETATHVHTYVIDTNPEDLELDFSATWPLAPRPVNPDRTGVQPFNDPHLITLTTCADLFQSRSRLVAFGHLVSSVERSRTG